MLRDVALTDCMVFAGAILLSFWEHVRGSVAGLWQGRITTQHFMQRYFIAPKTRSVKANEDFVKNTNLYYPGNDRTSRARAVNSLRGTVEASPPYPSIGARAKELVVPSTTNLRSFPSCAQAFVSCRLASSPSFSACASPQQVALHAEMHKEVCQHGGDDGSI